MLSTYLLCVLLTFVTGLIIESLFGGDRVAWEDWIWPAVLWPAFVLVVVWFFWRGDRK